MRLLSLPVMRRAGLAAFTAALLAGCATPPQGMVKAPASPDMTALLTAYAELKPRPVASLTPEQARMQPTIADAVKRLQTQRGMSTAPMPVAEVRDITIQGADGSLPTRLYKPVVSGEPQPLILYFHGGGWVIADYDVYDASARALASKTGAMVLSVNYRRGPESRFPAAVDDAIASYKWVLANAIVLGGDVRRVALAGESAGGNLAIDVAIAARDQNLQMPVAQLLVYPVAGTDLTTPSMVDSADAKPLSKADIEWFVKYYTRGPADLKDPRLDVLGQADLHGLPPTTIVMAQIDPLRSGGELLADKLRTAGVDTVSQVYPGTTHEFFGTGAVVAEAREAEDLGASRLKQALAAAQPAAAPAPVATPHRRVRRAH